jgi:hypothetical protein
MFLWGFLLSKIDNHTGVEVSQNSNFVPAAMALQHKHFLEISAQYQRTVINKSSKFATLQDLFEEY